MRTVVQPGRRSRGGSIAVVPLALALSVSCGPVDPPPPSPIPVNACPPDSCDAYQTPVTASCSAGLCISNGSIDGLTLLVSLPASSSSLEDPPGVTIAIPQFPSYLQRNPCAGTVDLSCGVVPVAVQQRGTVTVDGTTQACAGRLNEGGVTLPADVRFWPLWGGTAPGTGIPAAAAGIPLLPVAARVSGDGTGLLGPLGTPSTRWSALLATGIEYEEDIVPLDSAYPPQRFSGKFAGIDQLAKISPDTNECLTPTSPRQDTTFTVARGNGSLQGFGAYFRDATSLRRISSLASLPDAASAAVTILTSNEWPPRKSPVPELVVAPPPGTPVPTYADTIATVTGQLGQVNYPPLPPPMTVLGTVLGPDGAAIEADLVIDSTPPKGAAGGIVVCSSPDCTQTAPATTQRPLGYSTTAHAGPDGAYSVVLPPGTYDVFVIPAFGVDAGATSVALGVQAALQPGLPPVAAGKTLTAAAKATIEGTVTIADGRPLVGATVEAAPSVSLAAGGVVPRRWPRAVATVTDGAGRFSLTADPGTYDVVVRPQEGTGFPWLTVSSQGVAAGGRLSFTAGSALRVPAPIFIDMTLQDQQGTPLIGAVVRAFAASASATPVAPGGPPAEVELGAWLTDSTGHFAMFLAPPQ